VSHVGVHDHGFNNISTYGNLLRLAREGRLPAEPWQEHFCELALKLSGAVQAARWTALPDGLGYIHSFNGPHSLFADTMRSLRSLAVAHQLGHVLMGERDRKISLLQRLVQHADTNALYNVYFGEGRDRYDVRGRVAHESIFNVNDGSYRCPSTQQGYTPFSTWTRGLAWAVLGFAEVLEFLGVAGVYHTLRHIADLKVAEEALRKSQEQLFQAQKMDAVGRLAGGVAHDFNNLLTVIGNYTALVIEDLPAEDPHRADLEEVHKASEQASRLTRQLLAFSRRQMMQPRPIDLNTVVADMAGMLRRLIGENIALLVRARSGVGLALADPVQVEQILLNLVVNARDAINGHGTISVDIGNADLDHEFARLHEGARPGSYVMLAVSDTGAGMDRETQRRIFEPFFTTKELGKGTGLGLSTVYGIVKQSGGYVAVYSEPGQGSVFRVYLPRVGVEEPTPLIPTRNVPIAATGTGTILLVEDERNVRELVRKVLLRHGYEVLAAENGHAALEAMARHPGALHLVLTDVIMPQVSGRELVAHIRLSHPGIRVVYMSGYADQALTDRAALGPDVGFLAKPFATRDLLKTVRDALADLSMGADSSQLPTLPPSAFGRAALQPPR